MRQESDRDPGQDALDAADRASRDLSRQVERARLRLLREYRDIMRERPAERDHA